MTKEGRKKKEKGIWMGPEPLGRCYEKGNVSAPWEVPSLVGRSTKMEGDLLSLGGEYSNKFAEGKMETYTDRSVLIACPALIFFQLLYSSAPWFFFIFPNSLLKLSLCLSILLLSSVNIFIV